MNSRGTPTYVALVSLDETHPDNTHTVQQQMCATVPLCACVCTYLLTSGAAPFTPADKPARISFEFPVYELWEDRGPVRLRLKANKPLSMQGEQSVFIRPLEIIPMSARGE